MDTLRLRTLTRKSILGFGKYHDLTVGNIIDLMHTMYLRWVYYNCDMINFNEEVLKQIKIPENWTIEKPGKAPEIHEMVNEIVHENLNGFTKFKLNAHLKKVRKAKSICNKKTNDYHYTKSYLQRKNQGH